MCLISPPNSCRSWRRTRLAFHNSSQAAASLLAHHAPMMLTCAVEKYDESWSRHRKFLNPTDGRTYSFTVPDLYGHVCIGSSGSWLLMAAKPIHFRANFFNNDHELHLYNPFSATTFRLPRLRHRIIIEAIQVAVALEPEPYSSCHFGVLLIADWRSKKLHWVRANENRWSSCQYNDMRGNIFLQLVAGGGGSSKFYALTGYGQLACIDLEADEVLVWGDYNTKMTIRFDPSREDAYMVASDDGRGLLAVIVELCPPQTGLRVFRLDSNKCEWVAAATKETLKDKVLFLGRRGCICRKSAARGGKVYTAGWYSFGVFDAGTGAGNVLRFNWGGSPCWAVWVMPELIRGDRDISEWVPLRFDVLANLTIILYIVAVTVVVVPGGCCLFRWICPDK